LKSAFAETKVFLKATTKGGDFARKEMSITAPAKGAAPTLNPPKQLLCRDCGDFNTNRICVNKKDKSAYGACCQQGDTSKSCTVVKGEVECSPILLKAGMLFYSYCPMNNEKECGGKNFKADKSP
jgi:hypothetical protein